MSGITTDFKIEPEPDVIISKFMSELSTFLELEIKSKWETLELYKQILKSNPDDQIATQQVHTNIEELRGLIKSLLDVRKDSEFMNPDMANIIQSIESICPDCGEFKEEEQVTLAGPFDRPAIGRKKKKRKKASHVRKKFEFKDTYQNWKILLESKPIREEIDPKKLDKLWDELTPSKRQDLLRKMKLDINLAKDSFAGLPDNVKKTFTSTDKSDLVKTLGLIAGASLVGLYLNILNAPADKPLSQIKDEPVDPIKPDKPDREPTFNMPSSFVGKVTYSPDFQTMEINLSGKVFGFCNVPERKFDGFEGASSKGAFFNREIKEQHDC